MAVLPGVLGCSFDKLRTGSPCDVPLKLTAASCSESSKCKEVIPFYCSSLANPAAPATGFPLRSNKLRGLRSLEHFQVRKPIPRYAGLNADSSIRESRHFRMATNYNTACNFVKKNYSKVGFQICPSNSHPSGGFPVSDFGLRNFN
jgi:hypothetical protein